jgi:hypothetical protein
VINVTMYDLLLNCYYRLKRADQQIDIGRRSRDFISGYCGGRGPAGAAH